MPLSLLHLTYVHCTGQMFVTSPLFIENYLIIADLTIVDLFLVTEWPFTEGF